jgi:hypothetical protein
MTFEFGVFLEFPRYPAQSDAEAFAQSFAQADAAERLGIDAVWLAELHFAPDRSIASAPLVLASAIAARTRRMKIGIAVQVLPLCHPLRLAEEVATLDHISEGRLILGVGRSGIPRSYEAYGIPYSESRERFAEVLEILLRSCGQERFSFSGNFYKFNDIGVVPRPAPSLRSRLRVAATSEDTYAAIGAMGLPRNWVRRSRPIVRPSRPPATLGEAKSTCACRSMSATPKPQSRTPRTPSSNSIERWGRSSNARRRWQACARSSAAPSADKHCRRSHTRMSCGRRSLSGRRTP